MGEKPDATPEAPEASREHPAGGGVEEAPAGDSAGVYYLSVEAFEARRPRPDAPEGAAEEE